LYQQSWQLQFTKRDETTYLFPFLEIVVAFIVVGQGEECLCVSFICSASAIARYQKRISGPLLDYEKLSDKCDVERSETVRKRVQAARGRQLQRFMGTKLTCNAEMGLSEVQEFCGVEGDDAAIAFVGEGVSPGVEAGADDSGPGRV
jgi:hypothetical protein